MVSMSAVWDRTTEFLSDNIAVVTPVAVAAFFVPASLIQNLQPIANDAATRSMQFSILAVGVALSLIMLWGTLTLTMMAVDASRAVRDARSAAVRRLPAAVLVKVAIYGVVLVFAVPPAVLLKFHGADSAGIAGGLSSFPAETILLLIIYGVIVAAVLLWLVARCAAILIPIVAVERRGIGAVNQSYVLTGGNTWRMVGILLLYFFISQVSTFATKSAVGSTLRLFDPSADPLSLANVFTAIAVGAVETIFSVLLAVFTAKLYVALRSVHEASPAA